MTKTCKNCGLKIPKIWKKGECACDGQHIRNMYNGNCKCKKFEPEDETLLTICKGMIEFCELLSKEEKFTIQQKKRLLQQRKAFEGLSKLYKKPQKGELK